MRFSWMMAALCVGVMGCGDDGDSVEGDAGSGREDAGTAAADQGMVVTDGSVPETDGGAMADGATPMGDAGPGADAGELPVCGTPPTFAIDVVDPGECPTLTVCGGDEVGIWDFAGGCVEVDLSAIGTCPGATVTRREGFGRGCVDFDGTFARRVGEATVEIETHVPPSFCTAGGCMALQNQLRASGVMGATCADAPDGGCDCEASTTNSIEHAAAYTIEGNTIVSGGKRWDYCVEGAAMSYTDVSFGSREPGIYDLTRR